MMLEVVASLAIVIIIALCAASLAVGMGILQPANIPGPLMKILDEMTDRPLLKKLLAERTPNNQSLPLNPQALRDYINRRVYGQEPVVHEIVAQIVRNFSRVKRKKPIGVFMVTGPTGTGKTKLGKAIGEAIYGDDGYYLVEMSKLGSRESLSTLFGATPGLIGSDRKAGLMNHLIDHPRTVVILDEFEKADPKVQEGFQSAWNEGYIRELTEDHVVSTTDVIFILTANAREKEVAALAKDGLLDPDELSRECKKLLSGMFASFVMSRVDYVFAFQELSDEALAAVALDMILAEAESFDLTFKQVPPHVLIPYINRYLGPDFDGRDLLRQIERQFGQAFSDLKARDPKLKMVDIIYDAKKGEMIIKPLKAA